MRRRPFTTVIVGPSALFREGLARILSSADFRIAASASCVADLTLRSLPKQQSTLLIIDAADDPCSAVRQIKVFKEQQSEARIAVVANHFQVSGIISTFRVGANAYFVEVTSCKAFIKSLELVMLGETILPSAVLPFIFDYEHNHEAAVVGEHVEENTEILPEPGRCDGLRLSARQKTILRYLIDGDSNKTIARKINIAEATVKVHIKTLLRKIRVHNRTQAAIWAMNNSLFTSASNYVSSPSAKQLKPTPTPPVAQVLSGAQKNGSRSLPLLVKHVEGRSHVELPSIGRSVPKGVTRKDD